MSKLNYPRRPILLVDDEPAWLRSLSLALESEGGSNIHCCKDSRLVMQLLAEREFSMVLLDLNMPQVSSTQLLQEIHALFPDLPVFIVGGMDQSVSAVECLKRGARDYFVKASELARLVSVVKRELEVQSLERQDRELRKSDLKVQLVHPEAFEEIITRSPKMFSLFRYLEAIADSRGPVLITGESGVGKGLLAHALHRLSRAKGPWVPTNAAGLEDENFAATLFGQVPGPQSKIDRRRRGLVERARGGSLFLDEIGELSDASQRHLLRFAQDGDYVPVGGDVPNRSDARLICVTHHNLEELVSRGRFRKDLYYRLRGHHLHVPALRERREDLNLLLDHFLKEAAASLDRQVPTYPRELPLLLCAYDFPGNVRELRTMISDAMIHHKSRMLSMDQFKIAMGMERGSMQTAFTAPDMDPSRVIFSGALPTLNEMTQQLIAEALERAGGNQSIAAAMLGITRQALNQRLKKKENS